MIEIIDGISFQEYCLTRNRVAVLLNFLGKEHKKDTNKDKLIIGDFFLKFPELTSSEIELRKFDTKFSYFHWKPNYKLYNAVLADLSARGIITLNPVNNRYLVTDRGNAFVVDLFSEEDINWDAIQNSCEFIVAQVLSKSLSSGQAMIQDRLNKIRRS
ncbi:TPA: hypothetical protein ACGL3H_001778 [Streptococcus agalactiae]|uniref:Transcriptional regulator n=1 Tax=Streptococcus gallinaceus TaxID=165758 RepID=A0ABV2JLR4_9STRE|nr:MULTISPECIES: hypothetical protein [Streptococcus]HEO2248529.1 hypothetical protein [Streptococcus agalactiae 515]KLJ85581.1 hypothetical protein WB01_05330 [Streptococcus agalactiae]MCK1212744.1 hypothetical protein [Streptococcus uberis]CNH57762.1 Uncharacterised protein [Streptococcus agalactiae]SQG83886.1 Uncharacterised protein [Streptococcus uberis]